jgi:hypothetical protein
MLTKRTQQQVADMRGVCVRTVKRWAKAGVDIQDDAAIDKYIAERARPGKTDDDSHKPERPIVQAPQQATQQENTALQARSPAEYDFSTTEKVVQT